MFAITASLKNNRGFTFVELMIVIALIGVIAVPITTMFITNYVAYYRDTAKIKASSDMRFAFNEILDSFRRAKQSSIVPDGTERVNFQVYQGDSPADGSIRYDSTSKALVLTIGASQRTLLNNVLSVNIGAVEEKRISISVKTSTRIPINNTYIYEQAFDYKLRMDDE